jgi:hypothetical protein
VNKQRLKFNTLESVFFAIFTYQIVMAQLDGRLTLSKRLLKCTLLIFRYNETEKISKLRLFIALVVIAICKFEYKRLTLLSFLGTCQAMYRVYNQTLVSTKSFWESLLMMNWSIKTLVSMVRSYKLYL